MRIHVDVVSATEPEPELEPAADTPPPELVEDSAPIGGADGDTGPVKPTTTPRSGKKEKTK